jgi:hypothetical protein
VKGSLALARSPFGDNVGFYLHFDLGPFFPFDGIALVVGQLVRHAKLAIPMIGSLKRDLGLLGLAGPGDAALSPFRLCPEV